MNDDSTQTRVQPPILADKHYDAPFRETAETIRERRAEGILAVEMEAAALYAFARARDKDILCFAHVTNQMAQIHGDFEKGEADGTADALAVITAAVRTLGAAVSVVSKVDI